MRASDAERHDRLARLLPPAGERFDGEEYDAVGRWSLLSRVGLRLTPLRAARPEPAFARTQRRDRLAHDVDRGARDGSQDERMLQPDGHKRL
jgi:hypothetical protein